MSSRLPHLVQLTSADVCAGQIAFALLLSGRLSGLQNASIVAALPFSDVTLTMCVSLLKALREERPSETHPARAAAVPALPGDSDRSAAQPAEREVAGG
ncbi:BCCT family transporter [Deinococcus kurensis]|uniref:BCCT family transporter n=1 Tax=Deinococcus kurensis TaxID=2662757 RepID=UPI001F27E568|nr:BCCT family transporter [Deinococcus kurensis]